MKRLLVVFETEMDTVHLAGLLEYGKLVKKTKLIYCTDQDELIDRLKDRMKNDTP